MLKLLQLKTYIDIYFTGFCMQTYIACIPVSFVTAEGRTKLTNPVNNVNISLICDNSVTTQNCDFSGEPFKGFEVL
jgi:hypothetical protein